MKNAAPHIWNFQIFGLERVENQLWSGYRSINFSKPFWGYQIIWDKYRKGNTSENWSLINKKMFLTRT